MKNKMIFILMSTVAMTLQIGCAKPAESLQQRPEEVQAISVQGALNQKAENPKVNILFVVDNSGSMKPFQEKMAANIEQFANEFFDHSRMQYKIGVVPVYDSKYAADTATDYQGVGKRKMNKLGELVDLKGLPEGVTNEGLRYITNSTPNRKEVLKQTVLLGVQWGPEAEESFSPVLAVVDETHNKEKNQNFYDKDAYLAVIFLTDADDATLNLSADDFYEELVAQKKGDRSKILIAAAIPDYKDRSGICGKTTEKKPVTFQDLLSVSGGTMVNLCSNGFGKVLASFGQKILERVATQKIHLDFTPDMNSLLVTYGSASSPVEEHVRLLRENNDYKFDPNTNDIILSPRLKLEQGSDSSIWITAKPASLENLSNGWTVEL